MNVGSIEAPSTKNRRVCSAIKDSAVIKKIIKIKIIKRVIGMQDRSDSVAYFIAFIIYI